VKELDELPPSLGEMPSIVKVKNWYAESFQVNKNKIVKKGEREKTRRKRVKIRYG
jgi:hypothetical protein